MIILYILFLTGGINGPGYRTWHVDSACQTHFGVGPPTGNTPDWWSSPANEKPGCGLYDDRYTFHLLVMNMISKLTVIYTFIML